MGYEEPKGGGFWLEEVGVELVHSRPDKSSIDAEVF